MRACTKLVAKVLPPPKPKWQPRLEEMAQDTPWNWDRWRGSSWRRW
jgi:hypothetical protein